MPRLSADVLVSMFPDLDPAIVREVADSNGCGGSSGRRPEEDDGVALRHLLLLSKGHFLQVN
jgi:hypothetical protein